MQVIWSPTSLRQVDEIYDEIERENPLAARHMADALLRAGDSLVNFPSRGRPVGGNPLLRELVFVRPYLIRYRVKPRLQQVHILRVRHGARQPTRP